MTISNSAFEDRVYEIAYEAVDGTFSGTFLQGANWPTSDPSTLADGGPSTTVAFGTPYVSAADYIAAAYSTTSGIAKGTPFAKLVVEPAVKRIQAAHGPVPFRMQATRVYVTPATYTTTPP